MRHWIACHAILARDAPRIRNFLVVRYEHLIADPQPLSRPSSPPSR